MSGKSWDGIASPGCPGLETLLPVMLSEGHHARGIPLGRIVDLVSTNPAGRRVEIRSVIDERRPKPVRPRGTGPRFRQTARRVSTAN